MDERAVKQEMNRLRAIVTEQQKQLKTMYNKALAYGVECWEAGLAEEGRKKNLALHHDNAKRIIKEMADIAG